VAEPAAAGHLWLTRPSGPAVFLLVLALLASCTRSPVELRLVTPRQTVDQQIAEELARAFDGNPRIRLKLVPHANDSMTSLETLASGVGELALVSNSESYRSGIETVIPLYPTVLHIAYRNDLDPADILDLLTGTTVFAGGEGSPSKLILAQTVGRLGVSLDDIEFVETLTPHPDVIVLFAPIMSDLMDDYRDYRLFSIGTADQLGNGSPAEALSLLRPEFQPFVLPTNLYPGVVSDPVVTIAVDKLLVVRSEIPETVVYDLISEVLRLKPALSAAQPALFHKLTGDFDASGSTFVIHPGAQAYIERDAPSAYERYSGVAEVAVTVLVGIFSGIFAIVKIYRIRRKNRIDTFYERAIGIRKSVHGDTDAVTRSQALKEIRQLQDSAFDLLVDERLAADESFRIFITLSNDIISELRE
jgi:TRAP-type uncharacterized transport system substrate-binding protein